MVTAIQSTTLHDLIDASASEVDLNAAQRHLNAVLMRSRRQFPDHDVRRIEQMVRDIGHLNVMLVNHAASRRIAIETHPHVVNEPHPDGPTL